jgi:hypothetical protein
MGISALDKPAPLNFRVEKLIIRNHPTLQYVGVNIYTYIISSQITMALTVTVVKLQISHMSITDFQKKLK